MKLNYKKTLLVGFAFFLICLFWQAYDGVIPKILTDKFGMSQFASGIVMALDNILALFMLPLFGTLSDKTRTKRIGKRTVYILCGTLVAAAAFFGLSFADNMQRANISEIVACTDAGDESARREALETLYDSGIEIKTSDGNVKLSDAIEKNEFLAITPNDTTPENNKYNDFVVPARQAYAQKASKASPEVLIIFMVLLLLTLVAMSVFRSPAVALMPDVTPKPLRSKANAIINLMGALGGIIVLGLGIVFGTGKTGNSLMSYTLFFAVVSAIMLVSLAVFLVTVKEKKWADEAEKINSALDAENTESPEAASRDRKLSKGEMISLLFILASVVFWFMGYNAVTSKYSVYAGNVLNLDYNTTLIVAQAAAIISYIPVGILSTKFGRKKMIISGIVMLSCAFFAASFLRSGSNIWLMNALFALAGIGWATINVNSYPMVVELARGGDVGKYTGFYYTASMAAQIITPMFSGIFLDKVSMTTLFPYATVFVLLSLVTMIFVKHGDAKAPKKSLLENLDVDN